MGVFWKRGGRYYGKGGGGRFFGKMGGGRFYGKGVGLFLEKELVRAFWTKGVGVSVKGLVGGFLGQEARGVKRSEKTPWFDKVSV